MTTVPFHFAALGDSITAAFNAEGFGDNHGYSWATGHHSDGRVKSHFQRLKDLLPQREIVTTNVAVSGARASDLANQVRRLGEKQLDYATILIGANDVLRWPQNFEAEASHFYTQVKDAIEALRKNSPRVKILLVGVPDIFRLYALAAAAGLGALIDRFVQQRFGGTSAGATYEVIRKKWQAANAALALIASQYGDQVVFNSHVTEHAFEGQHVSTADFFHPSVAGQHLLAELTWHPELFS